MNEVIPAEKGWGEWFDEIKWGKSKVICIAPDFYEYEIDFEDEKITWIWLEWYQESNSERILLLEMDDLIYQEMVGGWYADNGNEIPEKETKELHNDEGIKKWAKEAQDFVISLDLVKFNFKRKNQPLWHFKSTWKSNHFDYLLL